MFEPSAPPRPVDYHFVAALQEELAGYFVVEDVTPDWPERGHVRFRGYFLRDTAAYFDEIRARFERHGFTPMLREQAGETALIAIPELFQSEASDWRINLVLFVLTVLSTLYVGALREPGFTGSEIWLGWPFSLSLLLILGAHELGHYFAARYHNVPVTLPYFIPFPTIFGTMGAFIRLKAPINNRRALFDVGVAGPLAGLVFAIPILFIGLMTSEVQPLPPAYSLEGNSLLYAFAKLLVFGRVLPAGGQDVFLNQVAWAGWAGLFVTGLNLIPVGQLDGGHIVYTLFGKRARVLYWPFIIGLIVIAWFMDAWAWAFWIVLLFLFGRVYAVPLDDVTPLDMPRRLLGYLALAIFILVFVPNPLQIVGS